MNIINGQLIHKTFISQDGIEVIINTETGDSYCSVKGYARLSGKPKSTIPTRISKLKRGSTFIPKIVEIPTAKGLQGVQLIPENIIAEWIVKDNPAIRAGFTN
ncbi:hypothetical protein [Dapis sp. BLCC M172]|uniref:hypothetical protein n=1 Tax=Dapis sp. BLCC M172 TaxID=2975281 RepID=UPI003CEC4D94